jgi:hypothetical protein
MDQQRVHKFEEVLQEEQAHLQSRLNKDDTIDGKASDEDHFSICFSGGGIRSAAFNLGVLQALAEKKKLAKIDYLSTVSGGGYIGSWFMALLQRTEGGLGGVQDILTPVLHSDALNQPQSKKLSVTEKPDDPCEPPSIQHLRTHSNFLAPKIGIFSTDLWALGMIYLRNTFLNSLVLAPLLLAFIFLVRYFRFHQMYSQASFGSSIVQGAIGISLLIIAAKLIAGALERCREQKDKNHNAKLLERARESFWLPVLLFALATAFIGSPIRYFKSEQNNSFLSNVFSDEGFFSHVTGVALLGGLLHVLLLNRGSLAALFLSNNKFTHEKNELKEPFRWVASGFIAGAVLAVLLYAFAVFFPVFDRDGLARNDNQRSTERRDTNTYQASIESSESNTIESKENPKTLQDGKADHGPMENDWIVSLLVACIIPATLLAFAVAESFQVGILGQIEKREVREKWSFLHAYCAVAAFGWLVVFLLAIVLPDWLYQKWNKENYLRTGGLAALWGTASGFAIWLAQSNLAGKNRKSMVDTFVRIGPYVALALGFVSLGLLAKIVVGIHSETFDNHWNLLFCIGCLAVSLVASRYVDINIFSLQELYENRLVRAFLGASRSERNQIDPVTNIDPADDLELKQLGLNEQGKLIGPIHLINTAINLAGTNQREYDERKAQSFVLSPLFCGSPKTGFRRTSQGYAGNLTLGRAFATSGAAVSPNMGYYSTAAVTALLTFCNLRLGGWFPNPKSKYFTQAGPSYGWHQIVREVLGFTNAEKDFVYLSDGGHFDNLGAYELVRRRCKKIYICDAGADPKGACHELALLIRNTRIDFGVNIDIDVSELARDKESGMSKLQFVSGKIYYPANDSNDAQEGDVIYIKLNITKVDSTDLKSYQIRNPDFPHQSTLDQFYSESQFESYRFLGYSIAKKCF